MKKTIFFMLLFTLFLLSACQRTVDITPSDGLSTVKDANHFRRLIESNTNAQYAYDRFGMALDAAPTAEKSDETSGSHSSTNIQVPGVDEGDVVKTDGRRIYTLDYNQLRVIDVDQGRMSIALNRSFPHEFGNYDVLYLSDNYLVVIGSYYTYETFELEEDMDVTDDMIRLPWFGYFYQTHSVIEIFDLDTLQLTDTFTISGQLVTTRLIDNNLYLISTQYVNNYQDVDMRPTFTHNRDSFKPEFQEIRYLPDTNYEVITNITHIQLDTTVSLDYTLYLGEMHWPIVYVNHDAIVLANNAWQFGLTRNASQDGQLLRFKINPDGSTTFHAKATYSGHIQNQFSIDEFDQSLRIVTTEGWGDDVINRLYIFDTSGSNSELRQLSVLDEGIGKPRETVRSVRFNQTFVTIVTYELIDPFYVIDLSNKTQPVILGELEVTGFSTYQHPWKHNTVIGIGYEADGLMTLGIKLSLYDISNPTAPIEIGRPLVMLNDPNSWQYSEALHNHKALFVSETHNMLGFAMYRSNWSEYRYHSYSEFLIFSINADSAQPIEIAKAISHNDFENHDDNDYYWYSYRFNVQRALTINDHLYVISQAAITAHSIFDDFETVSHIIHDN